MRTNIYATVESIAASKPLCEAAAAGEATFHVRRSDKSTRRMSYYPPDSPMRAAAERIVAMRANFSMRDISRKQHLSIPTVRRIINNLELSLHIEAGQPLTTVILNPAETGPCIPGMPVAE